MVNAASMFLITSTDIIKNTFINILYNSLSPYIANRDAIQNWAILDFHKFGKKVVISQEYFRVKSSNLGV